MTLLEVLVGFVIFSASLVAVLEYVGWQVFHQHRSDIKLQKLELVYEASAFLHAETE